MKEEKVISHCGIPKEIENAVSKNNGTTELVFILDESGSMFSLKEDTLGGFNAMINEQKKFENVLVTTMLFSNDCVKIHDRVNVKLLDPLTEKDYNPSGSTALLDAIGITIENISYMQKHTRKENRPTKTLFIITTDGMENASFRFSYKDVKKSIQAKTEEGWEFIFAGANIDACQTAESIGISRDKALNYNATKTC